MPKAAMLALVRKQKRVVPNEVRDLHFVSKALGRAAGNLAKASFSSGRHDLTGCEKISVFRGSELQLRHKVRAFNRALAPEERILSFFRTCSAVPPPAMGHGLKGTP
jgi:hypothetical protein